MALAGGAAALPPAAAATEPPPPPKLAALLATLDDIGAGDADAPTAAALLQDLRLRLPGAYNETTAPHNAPPTRLPDGCVPQAFPPPSTRDLTVIVLHRTRVMEAVQRATPRIPPDTTASLLLAAFGAAFDTAYSTVGFLRTDDVDRMREGIVSAQDRVLAAPLQPTGDTVADLEQAYDVWRACRILMAAWYRLATCLDDSAAFSNADADLRRSKMVELYDKLRDRRMAAAKALLGAAEGVPDSPLVASAMMDAKLDSNGDGIVDLEMTLRLAVGDASVLADWPTREHMWKEGSDVCKPKELRVAANDVSMGRVLRRLEKAATGIYTARTVGGLKELLLENRFRVRHVESADFPDGIIVATRRYKVPAGEPAVELLVLFRGSDGISWSDWKYNLRMWPRSELTLEGAWPGAPPVVYRHLHSGIASRAEAVLPAVLKEAHALVQAEAECLPTTPNLPVVTTVCGHGQGAALASLAAHAIAHTMPSPFAVKLVTFASPGVFAVPTTDFGTSSVRHTNILMEGDLVPLLGTAFGYQQTGTRIVLKHALSAASAMTRWFGDAPSTYADAIQDMVGGGDAYARCKRVADAVVPVAAWDSRLEQVKQLEASARVLAAVGVIGVGSIVWRCVDGVHMKAATTAAMHAAVGCASSALRRSAAAARAHPVAAITLASTVALGYYVQWRLRKVAEGL